MTPSNVALIQSRLRQEWSPEQVSGRLLREQGLSVSIETLYPHIWNNKEKGGDL